MAGAKYTLFSAFFVALLFFTPYGQSADNNMQLNRVIAVVNGELITMYDLQQHAMPEIMRRGITGSGQQDAMERERIFNESLDDMVLGILYRQEAERYMITVEDSAVDNEVRRIMQSNNLEQEEFERQLVMQGMSMEELRQRLRDGLIRQRLLGSMVARKAEVTPEEVENYYKEHLSDYSTPSSVEFSVIALGPGRNVAAIREEIASGKTSFAAAAKKYSAWPSAALGGSMGNIAWKDLNPAWTSAMQGLAPGQTSAPVETGELTVLLHVDALHEASSRSFEEVAQQIEETMRENRLRDRFEEYGNQLKARAVVEIKI